MINDKIKQQTGGYNSVNIQGDNITFGVGYHDVRDIALDTFKNNFWKMKKDIMDSILNDASAFLEKFIKKLQETNPDGIKNFSPRLQLAIYEAQKSYILSENKQNEEILLDLLIERTKNTSDLSNLIISASIETIRNLTQQQINFLSISTFLTYLEIKENTPIEKVFKLTNEMIEPFIDTYTSSPLNIRHLVYAGCGVMMNLGVKNYNLYKKIGNFVKIQDDEKLREEIDKIYPKLHLYAKKLTSPIWHLFTLSSTGIAIGLFNMKNYKIDIGNIVDDFLTEV